ncbi:hypothetical protein UPYG_G00197830 [Umbra pygmaea]|uniref:Apolipoprotein A-IV n=1 Tax=Umbra pygmaea TaxID=75934 RepID=A0ABD0WMX3_UMBPY
MHLKVVVFALSFLTTTAYPLQYVSREAPWTPQDLKNNDVHEKTDIKDVSGDWKTHVKNPHLYTQDSPDPMVSEIRQKLNLESERLRTLLRQELAEIREMLSPYPNHPVSSKSTLASMGDRLAPLTKQIQNGMKDNSQELCGHLKLYLQGLDTAAGQVTARPSLYLEAVHWISKTLDDSSAKMTTVIQDFKTQTSSMVEEFRVTDEGTFWQDVNDRLGHEVHALSLEVQGRVGVLKAKLTSILLAPQPLREEVSTSVEQFCQNASVQDQLFHARIEKHLLGQESQTQSESQSPSPQPLGLLEDFSVKLSSLLQDILHNVQ